MIYTYKAIDEFGHEVIGTKDASEPAQVVMYLKTQRMTPIKVTEGIAQSGNIQFLTKPKAKDLSMFCDQFCSLIRAGVSILDALKMLYDQTKQETLKVGIQQTISQVNSGEPLGTAMSKSAKAFDSTLCSLVAAGEASGSLDESLQRMAIQYKKDAEINAAVKKAMIYPIIVLVVAVGVIVVMLTSVIPTFMEMFESLEIEMPAITMFVINASNWFIEKWWLLLIIVVAFIIALQIFRKSELGHKCFSWLTLHIPVIKNFVIKSNAARISRTLSTLLAAGMSVIEALTILESTMKNYYFKKAIREIKEDVLLGRPMSHKFKEYDDLFPTMLTHMIGVGEDTGDMSEMLTRTADYYDLEVETATGMMMSLIQPVIILFLAAIVVVLLFSILSPMVTMYNELGDKL